MTLLYRKKVAPHAAQVAMALWYRGIDTLIYRDACVSDVKDIKQLLESYDLPVCDVADHIGGLVVAELNGAVIGVGGFEKCGNSGLLRSFAVRPGHTGRGIAGHLFNLVNSNALACGIEEFYLLTTTAVSYFHGLGFMVCNRDAVPERIRVTKQFSELCPCSAIVMVKTLCTQAR